MTRGGGDDDDLGDDDREGGDAREPIALPIDGTLDLHGFDPRELAELLPAYLDACRERGLLHVRVVHGKGAGVLRERVHALLRRLPGVRSFRIAGPEAGGWGATLVELERADETVDG